jgi:hypothetical protein
VVVVRRGVLIRGQFFDSRDGTGQLRRFWTVENLTDGPARLRDGVGREECRRVRPHLRVDPRTTDLDHFALTDGKPLVGRCR